VGKVLRKELRAEESRTIEGEGETG
jgi:hypothetical protein